MKRLLPIPFVLLAACTGPRTSETISGLRVLAIQAEPPDAVAGDHVHLETLVVTPVDGDPDLQITWYLCQYSSLDDCAKKNDLTVIGHGPSLDATIPGTLLAGDQMVYWMDSDLGGAHIRSLKAIKIRAAGEPPNHNPILDRTWWSATPFPQASTMTCRRKARVPVHLASSEVISEIHSEAGAPAAEDVRVLTYTTGGLIVDPSGTGASGSLYFKAPDVEGHFGAWIVVNDGRGGIAWSQRWFDVEGDPDK
jgi:hypothetical protein